ncbi:MAG: cupredoxin domain-containing protein [Candidatus Paceibacterota bacterium]|jgi:plastocyanin domain-containing protein
MRKDSKIVSASILAGALIVAALIIVRSTSPSLPHTGDSSSVRMENGVQWIEVTARGGYSPRVIVAKANIPTKLRMITRSTFDCSAAFVMPALGIRAMLPSSGLTNFDIPPQSEGSELQGLCGMGMYSFVIQFTK